MEDIYEGSISMGLGGDQYDDAANWANYTKKEKCVVCGGKTPYTFDTCIDKRDHYIYGVGQLCRKCYDDIYKEKDDTQHNTMDRSCNGC